MPQNDHQTPNDLNWLVECHFGGVQRREHDWVFTFEPEGALVAECLWRLVENNRICLTSADEGQLFGLSTPIDAAAELRSRLTGASVTGVDLKTGTLDLRILFSTGHVLELFPDSSGYEAWSASRPGHMYVATGGGELAIFDDAGVRVDR